MPAVTSWLMMRLVADVFTLISLGLLSLKRRRSGFVFSADTVWKEEIEPSLDRFISRPAFERVCREYVRGAIGRDPRLPERGDVGEWWGPSTARDANGKLVTEQRQADVVVGTSKRVVLVGECKWSASLVDTDALGQLRIAVAAVPGTSSATRMALFARTGFTDRVRTIADQEGIVLFTAADLLDGAGASVRKAVAGGPWPRDPRAGRC